MGDEAHGCVYTRGPKPRLGLCETVFGPLDGGSRNRVNWVDQILGRLEWKKDGQTDRSHRRGHRQRSLLRTIGPLADGELNYDMAAGALDAAFIRGLPSSAVCGLLALGRRPNRGSQHRLAPFLGRQGVAERNPHPDCRRRSCEGRDSTCLDSAPETQCGLVQSPTI